MGSKAEVVVGSEVEELTAVEGDEGGGVSVELAEGASEGSELELVEFELRAGFERVHGSVAAGIRAAAGFFKRKKKLGKKRMELWG